MEQLDILDALAPFLAAGAYLALCGLSRWHAAVLDNQHYLSAFLRRVAPELGGERGGQGRARGARCEGAPCGKGEAGACPPPKRVLADWARKGEPMMEEFYLHHPFGRASAAPGNYLERAYGYACYRRCAALRPEQGLRFEPLVPWFLLAWLLAGDARAARARFTEELRWEGLARALERRDRLGGALARVSAPVCADFFASKDEHCTVLLRAGVPCDDAARRHLVLFAAVGALAALKELGQPLPEAGLVAATRETWERAGGSADPGRWAKEREEVHRRLALLEGMLL